MRERLTVLEATLVSILFLRGLPRSHSQLAAELRLKPREQGIFLVNKKGYHDYISESKDLAVNLHPTTS